MTDRLLVLVRHGQSEWNLTNQFTGWKDVDLTPTGVDEARAAGRALKAENIRFHVGFTSVLKRAQRSLELSLEEMGQEKIPAFPDQARHGRDRRDPSRLNKEQAT